MFRLIAVTLAALYAVLQIFGDEARRPDVARSEPLGLSVIKAAYVPDSPAEETRLPVSKISEAEAIRMALEAGAQARSERERAPYRGTAVASRTEPAQSTETADEPIYWYVTGTRVNLRSGPGTSNGIVGSLTLGAEAEVLADRNGWYEIRTADGATSGWIFGKFLSRNLPG